jgi:pimeloyl-ACP methyl ester carboxylesterase
VAIFAAGQRPSIAPLPKPVPGVPLPFKRDAGIPATPIRSGLSLFMQSSSRLFPVALLSADRRGDLSEDVYRIKAANSPDASVELALTRVGLADEPRTGAIPVILLHGSFSNRRFWYSARGIGLGAWLARRGFDVWIPEMRGHGLSPRNLAYRHNRVADYARYDLPVINAFVREVTGCKPHWIGHSLGGITLAAAVGGQFLGAEEMASIALFGSQVSRQHWAMKVPPLVWGARLLLRRRAHFGGARFKRGPEDEPVGVVLEVMRWHGLFGKFAEPGNDWWAGLAHSTVPVMAVAGGADRQSPVEDSQRLFEQFGGPVREFVELSRKAGYSEDFDHVQMLVSKAAQAEVWPLVARWIEASEQRLAVELRQAG